MIWKQELQITDTQELMVPKGSTFLSVAEQYGVLCIWFRFDEGIMPYDEKRVIDILGTGNTDDVGLQRDFIGTVLMRGLVWHVFERMVD